MSSREQCAPGALAFSPTGVSMPRYVKVAFFRGTSLRPVPPGESKHKKVRYIDIREDDQLDETQMAKWIQQAAALPGWVP